MKTAYVDAEWIESEPPSLEQAVQETRNTGNNMVPIQLL